MKTRSRVLGIVLILLAGGIAALAVALSHNSPCGTAASVPAGTQSMKAIVRRCYGTPEVLRLEEIARPTPKDDEVLIRVHAASVNPLDWHYVRGTPYVVRLDAGLGSPTNPRLGVDLSGTVEAVGRNVKGFTPGEEVFGGRFGAFAEYIAASQDRPLVLKPPNLSFEQAAALPIAALTALQALRDQAHVHDGQKVLVIGASGGVGTFAVQIARILGAEVTGVSSTRNLELVHSLGAAHVIDYTHEDVLRGKERYDVIMDNVGDRSLAELLAFRRIMVPRGVFVLIGGGGPQAGDWIGPLSSALYVKLLSPFVSEKFVWMEADLNKADLDTLADMAKAGRLKSVIDRQYKLAATAEALKYLERGHARGKVIIEVD